MFTQENHAFTRTLNRSEKILEMILKKSQGEVSGKDAFMLQDTYGLPFEILENLVTAKGFTVDRAAYDSEMEQHRTKSRNAKQ